MRSEAKRKEGIHLGEGSIEPLKELPVEAQEKPALNTKRDSANEIVQVKPNETAEETQRFIEFGRRVLAPLEFDRQVKAQLIAHKLKSISASLLEANSPHSASKVRHLTSTGGDAYVLRQRTISSIDASGDRGTDKSTLHTTVTLTRCRKASEKMAPILVIPSAVVYCDVKPDRDEEPDQKTDTQSMGAGGVQVLSRSDVIDKPLPSRASSIEYACYTCGQEGKECMFLSPQRLIFHCMNRHREYPLGERHMTPYALDGSDLRPVTDSEIDWVKQKLEAKKNDYSRLDESSIEPSAKLTVETSENPVRIAKREIANKVVKVNPNVDVMSVVDTPKISESSHVSTVSVKGEAVSTIADARTIADTESSTTDGPSCAK